jgi:hypothetical protein
MGQPGVSPGVYGRPGKRDARRPHSQDGCATVTVVLDEDAGLDAALVSPEVSD